MSAKRMVRHAGIGLVFALALAAATGGCRNTEKNAVDDALIAARVRHELTETSELARFPIVVDAMAGKVTLDGRVDRSEQRETAEMLTRKVEGVERVSNRIVVAFAQAELPAVGNPSNSDR